MVKKICDCLVAAFICLVVQQSYTYSQVEIILSTAGPLSDIGVPNQPLNAMYNFSLSPDGQWWTGEFELDNVVDTTHLRGQGAALTDIIWIEGDPVPGFAGTFDSISDDRQTAVSNDGTVVGVARRNVNGAISPLVYRYSNSNSLSVVATQDQLVPALPMARYDNVLHSPNVMPDGMAAFVAENITFNGMVIEEDEISLTNDGAALAGQRKAVTSYNNQLLQNFNDEQYFTNGNGFFLFAGDTDGPTVSDDIVVFGQLGKEGMLFCKRIILRSSFHPE